MRTYKIIVNGRPITAEVKEFSQESARIEIDGNSYAIELTSIETKARSNAPPVRKVEKSVAKAAPAMKPSADGGSITAPLPGAILEVYVKVGDKVSAGQKVLKMEAMKMENEINATADGVVSSIAVKAGDVVNQGQALMSIE
jgi:biotin carboxyl carrier protein